MAFEKPQGVDRDAFLQVSDPWTSSDTTRGAVI